MIRTLITLLALTELSLGAEIVTNVGTGEPGSTDGPAREAQLNNPFGLFRGPDGDLWFYKYDGHTVHLRISAAPSVGVSGTPILPIPTLRGALSNSSPQLDRSMRFGI